MTVLFILPFGMTNELTDNQGESMNMGNSLSVPKGDRNHISYFVRKNSTTKNYSLVM